MPLFLCNGSIQRIAFQLKTIAAMITVTEFTLFKSYAESILHGYTDRRGGTGSAPFDSLNVRFGIGDDDKNVEANRGLIAQTLGVSIDQIFSANQNHGVNVYHAGSSQACRESAYGEIEETDAIITDTRGVMPFIQVADCQGLLLFDPVRKAVAAIHAGWRGLVQGIIPKTVEALKQTFGTNPADLIAGISPSLGPCCARFSHREQEFPSLFQPFFVGEDRVDLWRAAEAQLNAAGLARSRIENARVCTCCSVERFFSYRRAAETGRFAVFIMLS